jgi:hypothetical protein
MTRTRLPRLIHGRWAWLTASVAVAAAGLFAVSRGAHDRDQEESRTAEPAGETAGGAAGVGTRLRQARMAANARIRAAGSAVRELFSNHGGTPSEPDTAENAQPAADPAEAAAPERHNADPVSGNGSAAQASAADEVPAHDG